MCYEGRGERERKRKRIRIDYEGGRVRSGWRVIILIGASFYLNLLPPR